MRFDQVGVRNNSRDPSGFREGALAVSRSESIIKRCASNDRAVNEAIMRPQDRDLALDLIGNLGSLSRVAISVSRNTMLFVMKTRT